VEKNVVLLSIKLQTLITIVPLQTEFEPVWIKTWTDRRFTAAFLAILGASVAKREY
jgi:hypothetical protein